MQQTSREVVLLLRRLAEAVESNKPVVVPLANESVFIPGDAEFKVRYESGNGAREMVIEVSWQALSSVVPILIHKYSQQVQDTNGNLYDVFIYGDPRTDGTWEGRLEFVPLRADMTPRRTGRETTQPHLTALEYWATGLEPLYIEGAFERAA